MPGASVYVGTGATITFGTSGFSAQVKNISWGGITREILDTTYLGTPPAVGSVIGSKTYLAGLLSDPGELSLEGHHNADLIPPIEGDPETITVTFPLIPGDTTPADWEATGQMTTYEFDIPLEELQTFTATVKIEGPITVTAAT